MIQFDIFNSSIVQYGEWIMADRSRREGVVAIMKAARPARSHSGVGLD